MVHETSDHMSAVKKLNLRKSIKSPFNRKSSKNRPIENLAADDHHGESTVVVSPVPPPGPERDGDEQMCQRKDSGERKMDAKSRPIIGKGSTGKSNKWPFRNRRSEDDELVKTDTKITHHDDLVSDNNGQPGSALQNNGGAKPEPAVFDLNLKLNTEEWGKQSTQPPPPNHLAQFRVKGESYVVPVRQEQMLADKMCGKIGMNGSILKEAEMVGCNGLRDDLNGNPSSACIPPLINDVNDGLREKTDSSELQLQQSELDVEVPPRIPPKPPSLRNKTPSALNPCLNFFGTSDELDDDTPPRPPARPKNRVLGKGSLRLWNDPQDNRATIYETISLEPKEASLAEELGKLPRQPWYWGPLTQVQAEEKLGKLPDGSFLVRDSSDERYLLSLSFNSHGRTLHTRIEYGNGMFCLNDSDGHTSIVELITCAVKESRSGVYGYMRDALGVQSFPARLTNWVSRFSEVRSLQHLCRFLIREVYPRHHIQHLPLPKKIKEYILENQY